MGETKHIYTLSDEDIFSVSVLPFDFVPNLIFDMAVRYSFSELSLGIIAKPEEYSTVFLNLSLMHCYLDLDHQNREFFVRE